MKINYLFIMAIFALMSCKDKRLSTKTMWISGFEINCEQDSNELYCFFVNKSEVGDNWEPSSSIIQGFEFEQGYLKKIEVSEQDLEDDALDSDKSIINLKLIRELEKELDPRLSLASDWQLIELNGASLEDTIIAPTLKFNLKELTINGNGGCNTYNGMIKNLGLKSIQFGNLINTLQICPEPNIESDYFKALSQVTAFAINDETLTLYNKAKHSVLVFEKNDKTSHTIRIHDIWSAVRIEKNPINRMVTIPRLEINTTEMKIYGNDGCNNYFGTISDLTEHTISFTNIGSTRKMCQNMELPDRYNKALAQVFSFKFDERILILMDNNGQEVLAFLKSD